MIDTQLFNKEVTDGKIVLQATINGLIKSIFSIIFDNHPEVESITFHSWDEFNDGDELRPTTDTEWPTVNGESGTDLARMVGEYTKKLDTKWCQTMIGENIEFTITRNFEIKTKFYEGGY